MLCELPLTLRTGLDDDEPPLLMRTHQGLAGTVEGKVKVAAVEPVNWKCLPLSAAVKVGGVALVKVETVEPRTVTGAVDAPVTRP